MNCRERRRERLRELVSRSIPRRRRRHVMLVELDVIPMPAWAYSRRVPGLSMTERKVWLWPKDAIFLAARDRECGGNPMTAEAEFRHCPNCERPLLGEDARARRALEESSVTAHMLPCGGECIEAQRDKRWRVAV